MSAAHWSTEAFKVVAMLAVAAGLVAVLSFGRTQAAAPAAVAFNPRDAAVFIETFKGHGSGVVIAPGLVLTAKHVVDKAEGLKANGRDAKVLWTGGKGGDIALLAADTSGRRPAEINCAAPAQGDDVVIHGNPLVLRNIATHGKVGSSEPQTADPDFEDSVVIDATIAPGNSGGGVFNTRGQLVGIVNAVMMAPSSHPFMQATTPLGLMTAGPTLCKLLGRAA